MFARKAAIALRNKRRQELIHTLFTFPKDVNILVELGKLYFEEKKYHFALDLITRATRLKHNEAASWKCCGDCHVAIWNERPLISKKHLLHALSCYRRALKSITFSSNPSFLVSVADVYMMYGSFPGALAVLSQIIQNFPSYKNLHLVTHRAAVILFQIERHEDSLRYLKHVLQRPPESYGRKYVLMQMSRVLAAHENEKASQEILLKAYVMFKTEIPDIDPYETWSVNPSVWIEAARICEKERDYPFELSFLSHALTLQDNKIVSRFPFHKLAYACYRVGDEARAVLEMQKWLAKNPDDAAALAISKSWTVGESSREKTTSMITIKTGLVFLDPDVAESSKDSTVAQTLRAARSDVRGHTILKKTGTSHPIDWLSEIYVPPPSAQEIARKKAEEERKRRAEHEKKMSQKFFAKRRARRNLLGTKATSASLIQALARGRRARRAFKHKMRRRKRSAAIVLQKHVRAFNARRRVFNLKLSMKRREKEETQRIKENAMRQVVGSSSSSDVVVMNQGEVYQEDYQQQYHHDQQQPYQQQYQQQYFNDNNNGGYDNGQEEWTQAYDAATGQKYYYNNYTGETQWC